MDKPRLDIGRGYHRNNYSTLSGAESETPDLAGQQIRIGFHHLRV